LRLINDILDIEKIESGKMNFALQPVELGAALEQAIEANRGFADNLNVQLVLSRSPSLR
jgi:signal transduction histidine kinase